MTPTLPERLKALGERYEVGKFYQVPCVKTQRRHFLGRGEWVPIIGPVHEDVEFLNFPYDHWHVDWRFVLAGPWARAVSTRSVASKYGNESGVYSMVAHKQYTERIETRRMLCKREWPKFPVLVAPWMPALEAGFEGVTMKNMVCPHRGIPLDGCETHGDVVTCPGHGLRWNFKTGALVTDAARPTACATDGGGNG